MSLANQITEKSTVKLKPRPATDAEFRLLRTIGFPEDALSFYRGFAPERMAEIGKARLLGPREVEVENGDEIVPGCYAHPSGYIAFATTIYGDSYCFDSRSRSFPTTAPVVLIAHDLEPENDTMHREDLEKLAKPVAPSFERFLELFAAETLDTMPLYPPFDFGKAE